MVRSEVTQKASHIEGKNISVLAVLIEKLSGQLRFPGSWRQISQSCAASAPPLSARSEEAARAVGGRLVK